MTHSVKGYKLNPVNPQKAFRVHLAVFLLVTPAVWLVWSLTDRSYPWPIWSTTAWTTGIVFHYLGVYFFSKKLRLKNK